MWLLAMACAQPRAYYSRQYADGVPDSGASASDTAPIVDDTGLLADDSGAGETGHRDTGPGDTGGGDPADPWLGQDYWTTPGPFASLLDLSAAPEGPHWVVWMATSPDGRDWSNPPVAIAHSFSALDLFVWKDHALVLLGGVTVDPEVGLGAPFENLFALTTTDTETWGSQMWAIQDAERALITDASLYEAADGRVRAAYFSADIEYGAVPPEDIPGDHEIKLAERLGDAFVEFAEPAFAAEGLIDPSLCSWEGESHLFAGVESRVEHATASTWAHEADERFFWGGAVPFCYERDGNLEVIAQASGGRGPPTFRVLQGDGLFSEEAEFFEGDDPFDDRCTSPVLGWFREQYVMFCAVHTS